MNNNFKFAIGDMLKHKDSIAILVVTGCQEATDVLLPCYNVIEFIHGTHKEWSCRHVDTHYEKIS